MAASGGNPPGNSRDGGENNTPASLAETIAELAAVYEGDLGRELRIDVDASDDAYVTIMAWAIAAMRTVAKAISHTSEDEIDLRLRSSVLRDVIIEDFDRYREALAAKKEAGAR